MRRRRRRRWRWRRWRRTPTSWSNGNIRSQKSAKFKLCAKWIPCTPRLFPFSPSPPQYIYQDSLVARSSCCLLNSAGLNWLMVRLGSVTCTVHSISAQPSLEGIKVRKAKEYLMALLLFPPPSIFLHFSRIIYLCDNSNDFYVFIS